MLALLGRVTIRLVKHRELVGPYLITFLRFCASTSAPQTGSDIHRVPALFQLQLGNCADILGLHEAHEGGELFGTCFRDACVKNHTVRLRSCRSHSSELLEPRAPFTMSASPDNINAPGLLLTILGKQMGYRLIRSRPSGCCWCAGWRQFRKVVWFRLGRRESTGRRINRTSSKNAACLMLAPPLTHYQSRLPASNTKFV